MPALIEEGRAKVNLTLRVVGRRVDGYHDLESVVAFADCADRLSLTPGASLDLNTIGPLAQACGESADNLVLKAAQLLGERVPGSARSASSSSTRSCRSRPGSAAVRPMRRRRCGCWRGSTVLRFDDPRLIEVAVLTGADVPVCLASRACDMTGVGETLLPLSLPELPCVMVNPRVAVATRDVFRALGLRHGELLVGATDVIQAEAWPDAGASMGDWIEALSAGYNDLEAPAMRIQPVIGEVLTALAAADGARLARMSGSGATCFAIFEHATAAQRAAQQIGREHPKWWVHAGALS